MIDICAIASGSNGNCYYIGNEHEAVVIDIGISNKQFTLRLKEAGLNIDKVQGIFISHEHTDHIKGMRVTCSKNKINGYITRETYNKAKHDYKSEKVVFFEAGDIITVGNIKVHSFSKPHDAADPVSFRVEIDNKNIAIITDIGELTGDIIENLKICDAAFFEANYDYNMLMNGQYPYFLKQRVNSNFGHLSNKQAFEIVNNLNGSPLKHILLSHISAQNNTVELALKEFKPLENKYNIYPTSREGISTVVRF